MKSMMIGALLLFAPQLCAADVTHFFRWESAFLADSSFQLNQGWWTRTKVGEDNLGYRTELYGFWESSSDYFRELNLTVGPAVKRGKWKFVIPIGARLKPEDAFGISHVIVKPNVYFNTGSYSAMFIHDLSVGLGDRENQHFLHYQFVWRPEHRWIGFGVRSDIVLSSSHEVARTIGPIVQIVYLGQEGWLGKLDAYPFFQLTTGDVGIKLNFLTLRFGQK